MSSDPTEIAPDPTAHLSWGKMIFRWHTIPDTACEHSGGESMSAKAS